MTRRTAALATAGGLLIALLVVALTVPLPYVVMSPGVTENTLGRFDGKPVVTIRGHKTYPTSGHLDLTTVSVTTAEFSPRLYAVVDAWVSGDQIVLPRDVVYPPEKSVAQVNQQNETDMLDSQSIAVGVGLEQAGIDAIKVRVTGTTPEAPADGVLEKGDVITSVDGDPVKAAADAVAAISALAPGSDVRVGITRDDRSRTVDLVTGKDPQDPAKSKVGAGLLDDFDPPFDVNIELGQQIGGPSAGMMFSLAIYDKLTPGALTGGTFVAGTGTISADGIVGPIGGVQQKIAGAYASGATVFLVPAGDCEEAAGSNLVDDIELIKVATIDEAIKALEAVTAGDDAGLEKCGS